MNSYAGAVKTRSGSSGEAMKDRAHVESTKASEQLLMIEWRQCCFSIGSFATLGSILTGSCLI